MLNKYKIGDEVTVHRDVYPLELSKDTRGVVKEVFYGKKEYAYIVKWRGHEIVCSETDLVVPLKKFKYHKHYISKFKEPVQF